MRTKLYPILLIAWGLLTGCPKKNINPLLQLPPETQEGKNTYGCLVNGKAWIPKGNPGGITSCKRMDYDPGYAGGAFGLSTCKIEDSIREYMYIFSAGLTTIGAYSLDLPRTNPYRGAHFDNYNSSSKTGCDYFDDNLIYRKGSLTITKLDLQQLIISGRFEFTLARSGCDTVKITDGRFDMKL